VELHGLKKILQVVFVALLFGQAPEHPFRGVTHVARGQIHVVTVDLSTPGLHFKLTPPGGTRETLRQTTLAFLNQEHSQVALNAHFFLPFPSNDLNADLIGLAVSDGRIISNCEHQPVQSYAIVADAPALNIDRANHASIVPCENDAPFWTTVSGSAQIVTNGVVTVPAYKDAEHPNGLLTPNADYSNQHSWYDLPRARTAIGLTRDNGKLVLFTVEAGRNGETSGMTVGELANLLVKDYAVYNALNLDGGGSTSLVIDGTLVTSGSREVGSSLAVFAER
jgi:N-acetylglucosamine-1-phosphodiester alpha-N-acetylglucosaminidase